MTSVSTLKTLLFTLGPTLGPLLLPRLLGWYRTQKVKASSAPVAIQPVPKPTKTSLNILFISAATALVSTFPYFAPANVFSTAQSRLQTPNDVLFTRLAALAGGDNDQLERLNILKPKLASLDSRLLYFTYGPDVLQNCPFCMSDEPLTYFWYALPAILLPHIMHGLALGFATSTAFGDKYGKRWRTIVTMLGVGLAILECYLYVAYDWKANARATRPELYVHFYWRMRVYRGVSIAIVDLLIACLLYLTSTNRLFVVPASTAERLEAAMRQLDGARGKMNATAVIRNVQSRDEALRHKAETYWKQEGHIMGEVMHEREVVEGVQNALSGRIQIAKVEEDARKYAEGITSWPSPSQMNGS